MSELSPRRTARPPYAPLKGARDFFERVTSKNPPPRIDREYLATIGVAANNEQHLVGALRFLDLIDEAGTPTRHFHVLYLRGPDRTRGLQNLIRQAYPSLFTGEIALDKASRAELHDHFVRRYQIHGQMARKATSLFALLCGFAGIPISPDLSRQARPESAEHASGAIARRAASATSPSETALSLPVATPHALPTSCPVSVVISIDMSEDDIVALLRRVRRAIDRLAHEQADT